MVGYETVKANIPVPDFREKDIIDVQDTQDIINDLVYCFKKYNDQAKQIAPKFGTGYIGTDAKTIWSFIKGNINYIAEPEKFQTTRSFSRIVHDKFGDCKHSALLASSLAWNLGYNIIFRFVGYDKGYTYGHVYTLIENPKTGKRFVIDPLQDFNTEKDFVKKVDYKATNNLQKFNPMLSRLTGIQTNTPANASVTMRGKPYIHPDETRMQIGAMEFIFSPSIAGPEADTLDGLCGIGKRSKEQRKEHRKQTQATRKDKRGNKKEGRQQKREDRGGSRIKKISLAPVRAAFSSLLMVNARGLASGFKQSIATNETEVKKVAAKLGYKYDTFKSQILKGATKKPLLGSKIHGVVHQVDGIGIVVTTAAFTAAAPAVLLALALFKSLGIKGEGTGPDLATAATEALTKGDTNISVDAGGGSGSPGEGGSGGGSSDGGGGGSVAPYSGGGSSDGGGGAVAPNSSGGGASSPGEEDNFYTKYKTPILVVGAGVVLYFANKKFKFI